MVDFKPFRTPQVRSSLSDLVHGEVILHRSGMRNPSKTQSLELDQNGFVVLTTLPHYQPIALARFYPHEQVGKVHSVFEYQRKKAGKFLSIGILEEGEFERFLGKAPIIGKEERSYLLGIASLPQIKKSIEYFKLL